MNQPLRGLRIVNTRASHQALPLTKKLEKYGGTVLEFPLISMEKPKDLSYMVKALHRLHQYHWLVFTSANSVRFFFEMLNELGYDQSHMSHLKLAAVGMKTKIAVEAKGLTIDLVPDTFDGEHLAQTLLKVIGKNEKVLFPKSHLSRDVLTDELIKANIEIDNPVIYETVFNTSHKLALNKLIRKGELDLVIFTSPSTVQSFFQQVNKQHLQEKEIHMPRFAVIGAITAQALKGEGIEDMIEPTVYTIEALVEEIINRVK